MKDLICVYTVDQLYKAETIKDFLAEENIDAFVVNKKDSSYLLGDVEIYVHPKDENMAFELIKGLKIE